MERDQSIEKVNDKKILPGNLSERMIELRTQKGLTQEELSAELEKAGLGFFDRSTISRVEKGETKRVNSELIRALSNYFDVSADFVYGLTDHPEKKNYELKELGLSYEAAKKLLLREVDPDAINRLMECEHFPYLCDMIAEYFPSDRAAVYEEISRSVSLIRNIPAHADDLGYELSDDDKRKAMTWTAHFQEPLEAQKNEVRKQFDLVTEDLTAYIRGDKNDPHAMDLSNGQIVRMFRQEVMKQKHTSNVKMLSEDDTLGIITDIAAAMMGLRPDEKELLGQLYRTMYKNRYEEKRLQ